ncbi:PREDICTED: probable hydrolase PNKD [Poecilia mexicana]|uniref:PNKD metallo-beta-lactamase domain containing n=2 Tax=Poecilia TaxID=8080 RepID=A0A087Y9Y8_POEFO|nr:PREDICTED: probable hydrolase PNKD [Poecilia formosa]XP_014853082.1 PREDICTED: probable hydrolase PNKD [Poecilia mexicana]
MSASCLTALRASLTAFHRGSCRWLLVHYARLTPIVCHRLRLHVSPTAGLSSSRIEPTQSSDAADKVADRLGQEEPEGPEYIPRKKAKNPMLKLGYAWMIGLPAGIIGFVLAKRQVDKNRLKQLKIRQRMKRSNEGEYDGSRYRQHAKLDR